MKDVGRVSRNKWKSKPVMPFSHLLELQISVDERKHFDIE